MLMKEFSNFSNTVWRRGSCEFTTCVSPCVKKATSHLQQLQGQLARWNLSQEPMQEYSMKESVTNDGKVLSIL